MVNSFKWRILRKLSTCAFVLLVISQLLDWYHRMQLDEATMDNPICQKRLVTTAASLRSAGTDFGGSIPRF